MESKIILVDFDATCVAHAFPSIGPDVGAAPVLRELNLAGHRLILFTSRSDVKNPKSKEPGIKPIPGKYLTEAHAWFVRNKIKLWGINRNPEQASWTSSPKPFGHVIIDDTAIGIPMKKDTTISPYPFVDWIRVRKLLVKKGLLND